MLGAPTWRRAFADQGSPAFVLPRQVLPEAPAELRSELSRRYVLLFEKITGQAFQPAPLEEEPAARMRRNVAAALEAL